MHYFRTRLIPSFVIVAVLAAALMTFPTARGASATLVSYGASTDSGVIDTTGDGLGNVAGWAPTRGSILIGEEGAKGRHAQGLDLRYVVPVPVSAEQREHLSQGAPAVLRFVVLGQRHLDGRQLVVDATARWSQRRRRLPPRGHSGRDAAHRLGGHRPVEVDVTEALLQLQDPVVTFRFGLDRRGDVDNRLTQLEVATADHRDPFGSAGRRRPCLGAGAGAGARSYA
jgi:hypothetical protein